MNPLSPIGQVGNYSLLSNLQLYPGCRSSINLYSSPLFAEEEEAEDVTEEFVVDIWFVPDCEKQAIYYYSVMCTITPLTVFPAER